MEISVAICTRNRADQLGVVLSSICNLSLPPSLKWEILVVDNGSTDSTNDVVRSFESQIPIKYVQQPIPGLSNARNKAIEVGTGHYFIWTDDDVEVHPNWLNGYINAFRQWPDAAIFGGKISPVLLPPTPVWFADGQPFLRDLLCVRDFGSSPVALSIPEDIMPWGANFAIRGVEQKMHRFNPDLGVAPGRRRGGEEIDVIKRLMAQGHGGWWIPDAEVKHLIPPSRQSVSYIQEYYGAAGDLWAYSQYSRPFYIKIFTFLYVLTKLVTFFIMDKIFECLVKRKHLLHLVRYSWSVGALNYIMSSPSDFFFNRTRLQANL